MNSEGEATLEVLMDTNFIIKALEGIREDQLEYTAFLKMLHSRGKITVIATPSYAEILAKKGDRGQ